MKSLLFLLAFCCMTSAHASLITYAYTSGIGNQYESHDAVGLFTVDDQRRGLVAVTFVSDPVSFEWEGYSPLMYDQPVSDVGNLYENGFEPFDVDDFECFLYLDLFYLDAGQDIFHNLDRTSPFEGAYVANRTTGTAYYFMDRLTKIRTVDVPEPSALALLGLGLLGFVSVRRRH